MSGPKIGGRSGQVSSVGRIDRFRQVGKVLGINVSYSYLDVAVSAAASFEGGDDSPYRLHTYASVNGGPWRETVFGFIAMSFFDPKLQFYDLRVKFDVSSRENLGNGKLIWEHQFSPDTEPVTVCSQPAIG